MCFLIFEQVPANPSYPIGLYLSLLLILIFYAYIFGQYKEQVLKIMQAAVNSRSKSALERTDSEVIQRVSRLLNVLFFINFLTLVWVIVSNKGLSNLGLKNSLVVFSLVLLFFVLKYLVHLFLSGVFKSKIETKLYLQDSYLKYKLFGILVFPFLLLMLFSNKHSDFALFAALLFFLILWLSKSFYGLKLGLFSKSFPKHYSFLYICTLEILPLLILGKIFWEPIKRLLSF